MKLDDLTPTAATRGVLPDSLATVVAVRWFASETVELTYKDAAGQVANVLLYRHDEPLYLACSWAPYEPMVSVRAGSELQDDLAKAQRR